MREPASKQSRTMLGSQQAVKHRFRGTHCNRGMPRKPNTNMTKESDSPETELCLVSDAPAAALVSPALLVRVSRNISETDT